MTPLSLGYSTCPNDTLAFYALAHGRIDDGGLQFDIELADVEMLNQKARKGLLDVTKLSFAALGNLMDSYRLLRSGAALGRGCGPLIVARPGIDLDALGKRKVAVPGLWTTAAMLLGLYASQPTLVPMGFETIMPSLQKGDLDIGVIIHEGRFTYGEYGLTCLLDLGEWWEKTTGLPIPLGCIAARRDLPMETVNQVEAAIRNSVVYGLGNRNEAMGYIARHAQEMTPFVIERHIDLYVNDFTVDLGEEGLKAVETFFRMATEKGLVPEGQGKLLSSDFP
jgi:1,4-dihydroxy-6-naphthoate synthase